MDVFLVLKEVTTTLIIFLFLNLFPHEDNNIITREIIDIKEDNGNILITTIEGIVKDNKLYNVLTDEEINDYNGKSIIDYQDKLNKITYTFSDSKLISLSK